MRIPAKIRETIMVEKNDRSLYIIRCFLGPDPQPMYSAG